MPRQLCGTSDRRCELFANEAIMKAVIAVLMGFISGFLIYMMVAMLTADLSSHATPSTAFVFITFVGGWVVSAALLLRGARGVSAVFRRGFLLGATEWLVMAAVGIVFSGKAVGSTVTQAGGDAATTAGAAIGGGVMAGITGAVSVFMAVVCLIGFAIAYFTGREMKDQTATPTRKCPECAEMIQAEARRCKHCGAQLATTLPAR